MFKSIYRRPFVGLKAIARLCLVACFVRDSLNLGILPVARYRLAPAKALCSPPPVVLPQISFSPVDLMAGYDSVAFTGSRTLPFDYRFIATTLVKSLVKEQRVFVGCATGVDSIVRDLCSWAEIFSVSSGKWGVGASAFARRSVAMLEALQSSAASHLLVAIPVGSAPSNLVPSKFWKSASGQGTWGTVAVAIGRGIPCLLFAKYLPAGGWGFKKLAGDWWFFAGGSSSKSEPESEQLSLFF